MPKGFSRTGPDGVKRLAPGTAEMIRDYFMSVSPTASQTQVFAYVRTQCSTGGWTAPSWHSFSNFFGRLKRLKLVIEVDRDPERDWREPHSYRLNGELAASDMWRNPTAYLYPR